MAKGTTKPKVPIFKRRVNPAFHRHPKEGNAIGRLVSAFAELELHMAMIAARNSGNYQTTMRALYRLRTTSTRISLSDVFLRPETEKHGIGEDYAETYAAIGNCLEIRNRYAHAQWSDDPQRRARGLYFADLQKAADADEGFRPMHLHISLKILKLQADYFVYAQDCLFFLEHELVHRAAGSRNQIFPMPLKLALPTAHSDPRKYIPPWLDADDRALHIERARAMVEGTPAPTRKQKEMDAAKAKKRARKAALDQRSQERDPKPKA